MRAAAFLGIFFLFWITPHPFVDLRDPNVLLAVEDGNVVDQLCVLAALGVASVFIVRRWNAAREAVSPALLCLLAWGLVSVVTSTHPDLSLRRYVLMAFVLAICLAAVIIPRDEAQFSRLLAIGSASVLALAYFGVLFMPAISIHNLAEVLELDNAGSWRGHFPHKNTAGAAMVYLMAYGFYVSHRQGRVVGWSIAIASAIFLVQTHNKTSLGLVAGAFGFAWLAERSRSFAAKVCCTLLPVGAMLLFTLGSVIFEPIGALVAALSDDPTFTNRTMIWSFALDNLAQHPLLGFGFEAFWKTSELVNDGGSSGTAATTAGHAHDAYLNVALTMGLPGLIFTAIWTMWQPLRDFHLGQGGSNSRPFAQMNLRIWLFTLFYACLESPFFASRGPIWFSFVAAVFGLRLAARTRQVVDAETTTAQVGPLGTNPAPALLAGRSWAG